MLLLIRNMESVRCKTTVKTELKKLGIQYKYIRLGEVELSENVSNEKLKSIDIALRNTGYELIDDIKSRLVDKIKEAVHQMIYLSDDILKSKISDYISKEVNRDYTSLSNIFTKMEGITIEKYIITQKIERIKELLVYDDISLSDIAFKLQYSSVAHLSNQFKKITGLTPSFYRQLRTISVKL